MTAAKLLKSKTFEITGYKTNLWLILSYLSVKYTGPLHYSRFLLFSFNFRTPYLGTNLGLWNSWNRILKAYCGHFETKLFSLHQPNINTNQRFFEVILSKWDLCNPHRHIKRLILHYLWDPQLWQTKYFQDDEATTNGRSNGFGYQSSEHIQDDEISSATFVRSLSEDQVKFSLVLWAV